MCNYHIPEFGFKDLQKFVNVQPFIDVLVEHLDENLSNFRLLVLFAEINDFREDRGILC